MAHYLLLIVEPPWNPDETSEADWTETAENHRAFAALVTDTGSRIIDSGAFDPPQSAVFPAGESRQTVTGYYRLECPDRATAERLAAACPTGDRVQLETLLG